MNRCENHGGCVVLYDSGSCPVCAAFRCFEFEARVKQNCLDQLNRRIDKAIEVLEARSEEDE
jgi:hypothetical protein